MRTHLLLCNRVCCNIRYIQIFLQIEWIPDEPFLAITIRSGHTTHGKRLFPYITIHCNHILCNHLLLLNRTPIESLSINRTMTRNGYILQFRTMNERIAFFLTITQCIRWLHIQLLIRREENSRIILQVQIYIRNQFDRTSQPCTIRHDKMTTTLFLKVLQGLRKSLCTISHAITYCTEISQLHRIIREYYWLHFLYRTWQIGIILVIRILRIERHHAYACNEG